MTSTTTGTGDETALDGTPKGDPGIRSVARAVEILSLLTEDRPVVTVSEIVRETELAKTTVVRMLSTLEQSGLIWTTTRGVTAGPGLWRWAHLARRSWELPLEISQLMRQVADTTGETVNLYVRRDVQRVCIAQQQSTQTLRHVVRVGDELPLWSGASSKVLLTAVGPDLLARVAALSPDGARWLGRLRDLVVAAQHDGWALSHGEREVGVSAVAVPVLAPSGKVGSALTVSGPTTRFTQDRVEHFRALLEEASGRMQARGFTHPFEG